MITRILILLFFASCASNKPTPYQKKDDGVGYSDGSVEGMRVATFKGNRFTKIDRAQLYSQFRAIENCRNEPGKHANIIDIFNKTIEKEVTRSTGSSWGPSYFGMYPYYSRYSSFGLSAGINTVSTDSWNETLTFPVIEVYYECAEKIFRPEIRFRELSADQINHLVKDVKGAIQVDKIIDDSPNHNNFEVGDIILRVGGKRIEKVYELIKMFNEHQRSFPAVFLREGKQMTSTLEAADITDKVIENEKDLIKKVCDKEDKKIENKKLCADN